MRAVAGSIASRRRAAALAGLLAIAAPVATSIATPVAAAQVAPGEPPLLGVQPAEAGLRLMGILVAGETRQALFTESGSPSPVMVCEGDRLGAWRVHLIQSHQVILDGPAGRRAVLPSGDPAARAMAVANRPPVPFIDPYRREAEFENDQ